VNLRAAEGDAAADALRRRADTTQARMLATDRSATARTVAVALGLGAVLLVTAYLSLTLGGSADIPLGDLVPALVDRSSPLANYVVFETRLPRLLGALLAGLLFGLSGRLYQGIVGNPLATPDIIGITSGATAGAVITLAARGSGPGLQVAALVGALVTIGLVYLLAWRGGLDTYRLILIGIAVSAAATAVTNYVLVAADLDVLGAAVRWSAGSAAGVQWDDVRLLALVAGGTAVACLLLARSLRGLAMGDDVARGLGVRVEPVRLTALALGATAAALVASVVGPIGFVALVAGPIAMRLAPRGPVLALAGLVGAVEVGLADVLAQNAPLISPVPTGVLTGVVGAPVFIWLLLAKGGTR
jgi:iron complex transport system permease protein